MKRYVGLDVSLGEMAICIVDEQGHFVAERKIVSQLEAMAAFIRSKAPEVEHVGLETGPLAV